MLLLLFSVIYYYVISLFPVPLALIIGSVILMTVAPGFFSTMLAALPLLVLPALVHMAWFLALRSANEHAEHAAQRAVQSVPHDASEQEVAAAHARLHALEAQQTWMWRAIPVRDAIRVVVHPALSLWLAAECGLSLGRGFGFVL